MGNGGRTRPGLGSSGHDSSDPRHLLPKSPTGIEGLDEVTYGGLPTGRPTLVCGGPGCGKTVLAMEFLIRGATRYDEPGLFVSFEESPADLQQNFLAFGFDLEDLVTRKQLVITQIDLPRGELLEAGEFTLDGLLIRLEEAVARIGARRIALDTLESLFTSLSDTRSLRGEIARLFRWLKDRELTAVITGERGAAEITRHGLEEYVSDCVLLLDHRISDQVSKRRLRIVKYRGSAHGKDEYPFLIGDTGFSVLPITSVGLDYPAGTERVTTGLPDLDAMLEGGGYYRGSTVLVSGAAGSGKSTLAAAFAIGTCERGEPCLLLAFEESARQMIRNMRSVGLEMEPWVEKGLLEIQAVRPTLFGLEEHLVSILQRARSLRPAAVIIDPVTDFFGVGRAPEIKSMVTRVLDQLRNMQTTVLLTSLTAGTRGGEGSGTEVSSLMDTWIVVNQAREGTERRRYMYVVKARGTNHSNAMRELVMSSRGLTLHDVAPKPAGERGRPCPGGGES